MEADAPMGELADRPEPLYDFLYRDPQRLASYYAQLFQGHLTQSEKLHAKRGNSTSAFKATAGVVGGDLQHLKETQESLKETFDPHDMLTVDVLSRLAQQFVNTDGDIQTARAGEMVRVTGRLVFLDKTMLEFAGIGLDAFLNDQKSKPKGQRDQTAIHGLEIARKALPKMPMPSSFMLHMGEGTVVAGTIKDAGLDEPISSSYFKHGVEGVYDAQVIGIKESGPGNLVDFSAMPFLAGVNTALRALEKMFFPPVMLKVTPLAIYREIV